MDVLSKLLMSVDAIKSQLFASAKKDADDYYEVVSPVDDYTLKMNDGSMLSFIELRGFSRILTDTEKRTVCQNIERSLDGFMPLSGYSIQIVDFSDPELTRVFAEESMKPSLDEMKAMGIDHPMLTTDYVDFIAKRSVWKKQFVIVYTSPLATKGERAIEKNFTEKEKKERLLKAQVSDHVMKSPANGQSAFLTDKDKQVFSAHRLFFGSIYQELTNEGALLRKMDIGPALRSQKQCLYGKACPPNWEPALSSVNVSKSADMHVKPGQIKVDTPNLVEQVISQGGTENDLPPDVLGFGNRLFTTLSMVIPQQDENRLASYQYLLSRIPKEIGYLFSFRMTSNPFGDSDYLTEQVFTGMSTILPMSDNLLIRRARTEMKSQHDNGKKTGVFLEMTVTLFNENIETLQHNRNIVSKVLAGWNRAQFRVVEMDKTQGLFDSIPGASKKSHLKQVLESFASTLYQSPMFMSGVVYDGGYLHFFTEEGQPFPLEEHSPRNINYNVYICGTPGSGKSTLLTMLNLALLVKPKTNPKLKGEMPLMMDVDFGKTSFGFKETIRELVPDDKKHLFLLHEFTTGVESSVNPHDLPLGRTFPTMRHKEVLTRFILVLIAGVAKDREGRFEVKHDELEPMIKYLVDSVYAYRQEDASPFMFRVSQFKHKSTIEFMARLGIVPNVHYSYFALADEVMKKDPKNGVRHAILLRRYAVPRLTDYSTILMDNPELGARYEKGTMANGKNPKEFFVERLADVMTEFQCFSRVTRINLDIARMVSLDINNVCGESDYRKAIFGSLCLMMYMVKRENLEESPDLMDGVPEQYIPYLKRLDMINRVLPGTLNIEEAHVLFGLFNDIMVSAQRRNRKAGWGMRTLSQNLIDPTDEFFSMCSTVFVTSTENTEDEQINKRLRSMDASQAERRAISKDLVNRTAFMYVKTKPDGGFNIKRLAIKLNMSISPGLLWISNSEQVDRDFKNAVIDALGKQEGLSKLSRFYQQGSVRGYLADGKMKALAESRGKDSVFTMLLDEISQLDRPSEELSHWL
jgi:intracellular multiplication protein IcmB